MQVPTFLTSRPFSASESLSDNSIGLAVLVYSGLQMDEESGRREPFIMFLFISIIHPLKKFEGFFFISGFRVDK